MPLFVGEFEQSIDAKKRLAIASALRDGMDPDEDGENFYLVLGPDRHLWLYPDRYYRKLVATLKRSPLPKKQAAGINMLFAMARIVKTDAQGRIVVPEKSMQRAIVDKKVTLVGNYDHIEIWPTSEWEGQMESALPAYGEMLAEAADRLDAAGGEPGL
jgi:MraZ protein